jgi:hypothetical protein
MAFKFKHYDNVECHHVVKIKVSEIYCTCSNYVMRILLVGEEKYFCCKLIWLFGEMI